jgi:ABC-2 type transport system permease protein
VTAPTGLDAARGRGTRGTRRRAGGTVGTALTVTAVYEFRMAARARVLWFAVLPLLVISALVLITSPRIGAEHSAAAKVAGWAVVVNLITTVGLGVALADRFVRIRGLGLTELLEATPASTTGRMAGTLFGALAAALAPVALLMIVVGGWFTVTDRAPAALGWAVIAFLTVIVPGALLLATFSATLALWVPLPVARVLSALLWFWLTAFSSRVVPVPSPTGTLLSPLGDYVSAGWTGATRLWAGRGHPRVLSPHPSAGWAVGNLVVVLLLTAVLFGAARATQRIRQ